MRPLLINPNTAASMTEKIGAPARDVAASGTEIVARNPATSPASIRGVEDGEAAAEGLVALKLGTSQSGPFARTLAA